VHIVNLFKRSLVLLGLLLPGFALAGNVAVCLDAGAAAKTPFPRLSCASIGFAAPAAGQVIDTITATTLPQSSETWVLSDIAPSTVYVWADSGWVLKSALGFPSPSPAPTPIPPVPVSSTGTVTLTWTAPTTNTDGSALTDLAGFHVLQNGTQIQSLSATALTTQVTGLANGGYSYTVRSFNAAGAESADSAAVSATVAIVATPKTPSAPANVQATVTITGP
jgi:hypothetical protein